ncbi:MAG: HRDC domain-containing protein [Verrucomicrobia bacterium]|nr:HRDC domain-containing protein [Verrucomicrobiota bacterium]
MIDAQEKLAALLPKLRAADWIALDTEADSLHAYPEKLCLMQVSIDGLDVLLDTLAPVDFTPALQILRDHTLIMHGSDYDLRLLLKTFEFVPSHIFDTMLAARLLGRHQVGLQNLVSHYLGVTLEKGPQKADWARRPLTPRMETYARHDTHYLKPLADALAAELTAKGRLDWHQEYCGEFIRNSAVIAQPDPETEWRVKGSHGLGPRGLAVLRELWRWREAEALSANRPPFFVLMPETMVALAQAAVDEQPTQDLIPRRFSPRRRQGVTEAIAKGLASEHKPGPLKHYSRRLTEAQARRYHDYERRRNRRATELGLDPSLIASRATLLTLAREGEKATNGTLMKWQLELLT